ncbi:MAG: hypothetical protein M3083_15365 [Actinomycetota bacterium]|nr:hypothetical protein [Actinomycetota bacterium]
MTGRRVPEMLADFRGFDWSDFEVGAFGERDALKLRLAIKALADDEVADATYRLANFGDFATPRAWQDHGPATWLMAAFLAAAALGRLPGADEL